MDRVTIPSPSTVKQQNSRETDWKWPFTTTSLTGFVYHLRVTAHVIIYLFKKKKIQNVE